MNASNFEDFAPGDPNYVPSPEDLRSFEAMAEELSSRPLLPDNVRDLFPGMSRALDEEDSDGPSLVRAPDLLVRPLMPRPWVVEDMIPAQQVSELRGDGGTGKSTLALHLCASAVAGQAWLGMPVKRGPAIYLASEDDEDELQRRLDAIAVHMKVERDALADLHLWPLATDDPALVELGDKGSALKPTARWNELERFVASICPAMIVLDSRADVFGGEEISRKQVRQFVAMLRKLAVQSKAAVIILAHPSLAGMTNRSGSSGSTHWNNAVRAAMHLRRPDDDEGGGDPDLRILEVVKNNYARISAPMTLRLSVGAFVRADDSRPMNQSREEAEAEMDALFLRLLHRFETQGFHLSAAPSASNYAPKMFMGDPSAKGRATKRGLEAAMRRLFNDHRLMVDNIGPPSRQVQKIVLVDGGA